MASSDIEIEKAKQVRAILDVEIASAVERAFGRIDDHMADLSSEQVHNALMGASWDFAEAWLEWTEDD